MKLPKAAQGTLSTLPREEIQRGIRLLEDTSEGTFSARFNEGERVFTVVWELDADGSRLACTCGNQNCEHAAALLASLCGKPSLSHSVIPEETEKNETQTVRPRFDASSLADSINSLLQSAFREGLMAPSETREESLENVLSLLVDQDLPDIKAAVANLRRTMTSSTPDIDVALPALIELSLMAEQLRLQGIRQPHSASSALSMGAKRKEEVLMLELARATQRTPFGDRREVSYFFDLEEKQIFRELEESSPGSTSSSFSEGPFPKRLLGNLVAIEDGPQPQRIRMLQYSSAGFVNDRDLDQIFEFCQTDIPALYKEFRNSVKSDNLISHPIILFAPNRVRPSPNGIVFEDENGNFLPLARGIAPALCSKVDQLDLQGKIQALIGNLVHTKHFLSFLPLSALVEFRHHRSLRRLS